MLRPIVLNQSGKADVFGLKRFGDVTQHFLIRPAMFHCGKAESFGLKRFGDESQRLAVSLHCGKADGSGPHRLGDEFQHPADFLHSGKADGFGLKRFGDEFQRIAIFLHSGKADGFGFQFFRHQLQGMSANRLSTITNRIMSRKGMFHCLNTDFFGLDCVGDVFQRRGVKTLAVSVANVSL